MSILLAIAFLALILIEIVLTKTFQTFLTLVIQNLIRIKALHAGKVVVVVIVILLDILLFVHIADGFDPYHVEEGILCEAISHD